VFTVLDKDYERVETLWFGSRPPPRLDGRMAKKVIFSIQQYDVQANKIFSHIYSLLTKAPTTGVNSATTQYVRELSPSRAAVHDRVASAAKITALVPVFCGTIPWDYRFR
jgi:hypothetical protein